MKKLQLNEESSLQDFLSMGYLFLLVLGVLKDTIYYGFLDIHILAYSSVMDVLLSPIVFLTRSFYIILVVIGMAAFFYWAKKKGPEMHRKYRNKSWYKKLHNIEKWDKYYAKSNNFNQIMTTFFLLFVSFFIGAGIGSGQKMSERLEKGELVSNYKLTFQGNRTDSVKIVGLNKTSITLE